MIATPFLLLFSCSLKFVVSSERNMENVVYLVWVPEHTSRGQWVDWQDGKRRKPVQSRRSAMCNCVSTAWRSWKTGNSGLPVVLTFLKCHRCPEIVLKSAIVLKFYSFGQSVLIWTLISKFVATRWHLLRLKCTKFDFGWGSAPRPRWGSLQRSIRLPPRWIWIVKCKLNVLIYAYKSAGLL